MAGAPASCSLRDASWLPLPGDRTLPFSQVAPCPTFLSPRETILQLEVNTPHMLKVTTEPRFLMAFPHASGPGSRQGTSREPPRHLEGLSRGRPHPDAGLDSAGSFKRSRAEVGCGGRGGHRAGFPSSSAAQSPSVGLIPSLLSRLFLCFSFLSTQKLGCEFSEVAAASPPPPPLICLTIIKVRFLWL